VVKSCGTSPQIFDFITHHLKGCRVSDGDEPGEDAGENLVVCCRVITSATVIESFREERA
jgi:hypothetical protein